MVKANCAIDTRHPASVSRQFFVLTAFFLACTLIYYFGELVDVAGWTALHWQIFYMVHDFQRLLFLIPILYAAYNFRLTGAFVATLISFIIFLPRAYLRPEFQGLGLAGACSPRPAATSRRAD